MSLALHGTNASAANGAAGFDQLSQADISSGSHQERLAAREVRSHPVLNDGRLENSTDEQVAVSLAPIVGQVTFGRAEAIVGRPVNILRPIRSPEANLPLSFPSRMPVAARDISSGFGMRIHPLLGGLREHSGVDLAAAFGSPIIAPSDAIVGKADWFGGYGLFVALEHGGGLETRYGHMSRLNVVAGQRVHQGDVIGYVGSTGMSTGPHLHYEVRVNGQAVNPLRRTGK